MQVHFALHDGTKLTAHSDDHITRALMLGHHYELAMLRFWKERYRSMTVGYVDVGAHIGNHVLWLHKNLTFAHILAFEPDPRNFSLLEQNLALNQIGARIHKHPKIVYGGQVVPEGSYDAKKVGSPLAQSEPVSSVFSNVSGITLFQMGLGHTIENAMVIRTPGNSGMSRLRGIGSSSDYEKGSTTVITTLDGVYSDLTITQPINKWIFKVDVEGMAGEVLLGGKGFIAALTPDIYAEAAEVHEYDQMYGVLYPLGYRVAKCFNRTPTFLFVQATSRSALAIPQLSFNEAAQMR